MHQFQFFPERLVLISKEEYMAAAVEGDWKLAAMVIDRLCLILYTLFTSIATVVVLWTAPHVIVA